jgi:hypothetical protein
MLSPRWHWIALLACVGTAQGVGAQSRPPDTNTAAAEEQAAPEENAEGGGLQLPPLRLSGHLSYDFRASRGDGHGSSTGHLVTATTSLHTFIYQPWLATVDTELGLTQGWSRDSFGSLSFDGGGGPLNEQVRSRERFITGRGRLSVFPLSRFPFEVHVERTDSRLDSGLASTFAFQTSNIGFSQRYRPAAGDYTLYGAYDHREQSASDHRGVQDSFTADFSRRWKQHDLGLGFTHSRASTKGTEDESRFTSLVARHQFAPSPALSVDTTANVTRSEDRALLAGSDLRLLQVSSVGMYRKEGSPLHLTGSVLGLAVRDDVQGNRLTSGSANLGASYEVSERLRLTAQGGVTGAQGDGGSSHGLSGGVGATYQGPSIEFGGARYDWFSSASGNTGLSDSSGGDLQRHSSLSANLGHSLGKTWQPLEGLGLAVSANQSLGWSASFSNEDAAAGGRGRDSASSKSLLSSLSATVQGNSGSRSGYGRVSFSDSMELGGNRSRFQLFNAQISGNWEIDSQRSLAGDITFQRTWERASAQQFAGDAVGQPGRSGSRSASGEISYRHARLWDQPRLTFSTRLKLAQDVLKQPGFLSSLPDRETAFWENRLDWGIGRLNTQLVFRMSVVDGRRHEAVMFRIQRSFGD